jgi:hypothetical protein
MRMLSCSQSLKPELFSCLLAVFLSTASQAEYLTTLNPAGEPAGGQPCRDTEGLGYVGTCVAHGAINRHLIYGYCIFEDGHHENVTRCDLCEPGYERYRHNYQWKCRKPCPGGTRPVDGFGCVPLLEEEPPKQQACSVDAEGPGSLAGKNPIDFATGKKLLTEVDFEGAGPYPLRFARHYNSMRNSKQAISNIFEKHGGVIGRVLEPGESNEPFYYDQKGAVSYWPRTYLPDEEANQAGFTEPASQHSYEISTAPNISFIGIPQWRHTYDTKLYEYPEPFQGQKMIMLMQPTGEDLRFYHVGVDRFESKSGTNGSILRMSIASGDTFDGFRRLRADGVTEDYSAGGSLLRVTNSRGHSHTLTYNLSRVIHIDDDFGNRLAFTYDAGNRMATLTALYNASTDGSEDYQPYYTVSYTYVPGSQMIATAAYPGAANPRTYLYQDSRFPLALTGVLDENGDRARTYTYRESGYADTTQVGTTGNTTRVSYTPTSRTVSNALGKETVFALDDNEDGRRRIDAVQGTATASCAGTSTSSVLGADGYVDSRTDARGYTTAFDYNERGLETSRTEAAGTPQERITTTEWHPDYALKTRIEDELLLTELHYNGDGLLDSRVETDKSAYNAGSRSWTYSYYTGGDNDGLLHQVDGPRTRVADLTTNRCHVLRPLGQTQKDYRPQWRGEHTGLYTARLAGYRDGRWRCDYRF